MTTAHPIHALALDRGIAIAADEAGCDCAVCGPDSPFPPAGRTKDITAPDTLYSIRSGSGQVCAACAWATGGKPSKTDPPLRSRSVLLEPGQPARFLRQTDWWDILSAPRHCVLSWATGGKKQHVLHAGWSTPGLWRIGADAGVAEWEPDPYLLEYVDELRRRRVSKASILSGVYLPKTLAEHGAVIAVAEAFIRPYRGSVALDLVCYAARTYDPDPDTDKEKQPAMISPEETMTVDLLARIAWGSGMRVRQGKIFWDGYYLARISRYSGLPLREMVSRLMDSCDVKGLAAAEVAELVAGYTDAEEKDISRVCQRRANLAHALAQKKMGEFRHDRDQEAPL